MKRPTSTNLALHIDPTLKQRLSRLAKALGHTLTWVVETQLARWVAENEQRVEVRERIK